MEDKDKPQLDYTKIAKAVVDEFMRRIYEETGKGIMKKIFWVLVLGALGYLAGTGHFPGIKIQ